MKKVKKNLNEILLAYYIFSFVLLARIIPNYKEVSTIILTLNVLAVILISIGINNKKTKFTVSELLLDAGIICLFVIDSTFRNNEFTNQIYTYMIIFAIIPNHLFIQMKSNDNFLRYYSLFALLTALLYIMDPFQSYKYSGDYMGFGYNVMLISYIGVYIRAREKKSILCYVVLVIIIFEMAFFANKGAILSIIIFTAIYEMIIKKNTIKNIIIVVICGTLIMSSSFIIERIYALAIDNGINSYSIKTLYEMQNKTASGLSGREKIWQNAEEMINKNFFFGNGAGYYKANNSQKLYTHNIVYDIMIEYGVIIFILMTVIIIKGSIKLIKENGKTILLRDKNNKIIYESVKGNFLNNDHFWKDLGGRNSFTNIQDKFNKYITYCGYRIDRGNIDSDKVHQTKLEYKISELKSEMNNLYEDIEKYNIELSKSKEVLENNIKNNILNIKKNIIGYNSQDVEKLIDYSTDLERLNNINKN